MKCVLRTHRCMLMPLVTIHRLFLFPADRQGCVMITGYSLAPIGIESLSIVLLQWRLESGDPLMQWLDCSSRNFAVKRLSKEG